MSPDLFYYLAGKFGCDVSAAYYVHSVAKAVKEAGSICIACTRGVHRGFGALHRYFIYCASVADERAFLAVLDYSCLAELSHCLAALIRIVVVEEHAGFFLVCEDNVTVVFDQLQKGIVVSAYGKGICNVE